jgi:hypothetical protein
LSDVVFGAVHNFAGMPGLALLTAFTIAFTVWGAASLSLSLGANLFFTAGAVIVLLGTTSLHWLARPHVFSWLFGLVFLAIAERERREPGRNRVLFALPLLACLWANMHGSYLLGPAILLLYAVGEWMNSKWGALQAQTGSPTGHRRFSAFAFLTLLATFINPYGWRLHEHVISYLQNDYLMDRISEFRSFSFHSPGAYYVESFLVVATVGIVALLRQRAYGPALLGIVLLHMSLYSARHFPTAAVLLLPIAAAALTREAKQWPRLRPLLDYSDRLRAIDQRILGVVPLAIVLLSTVAGIAALAKSGVVAFNPKEFPVQAANYLQQNKLIGRTFSNDGWGGYLIYRFAGRGKVFVDGRSDFYGRQFLESYAQVAEVKPAWNSILKQYQVDFVLIPSEHALASVLQLSPEWRRVYSDSVAAVFERVMS